MEVNDLDVQFRPFSLPTSCNANGVKVADLLTLIISLLEAYEQAQSKYHEILLRSHVEEVALVNHLGVEFNQKLPLKLQHIYKSIIDKTPLPTIVFEESSSDEEYVNY